MYELNICVILIRHADACCITIKRPRWVPNAIWPFKLSIIKRPLLGSLNLWQVIFYHEISRLLFWWDIVFYHWKIHKASMDEKHEMLRFFSPNHEKIFIPFRLTYTWMWKRDNKSYKFQLLMFFSSDSCSWRTIWIMD